MTMSSPKNSLSKPIETGVIRADHRAVTYIWNRGEGLYRLPERLLVLGEFEGPGFLEARSFAESPNPMTLLGPNGDRLELASTGSLQRCDLLPGRSLVVGPREHAGCELRFRSFELPEAEERSISSTFHGAGWLVDGNAEIDGARRCVSGSRQMPIPFFQECHPIGSASILAGRTRNSSAGGWKMANIEELRANGLTVQNLSKPEELTATWSNGTVETRTMACHLNEMRWSIHSDRPVKGFVLFRTYDAFHGLSQARVFVDDRLAGRWFCGEQDRVNRWRIATFGVEFPGPIPAGGFTVAIDPPAGAPLWSVSEYRWLLFHD